MLIISITVQLNMSSQSITIKYSSLSKHNNKSTKHPSPLYHPLYSPLEHRTCFCSSSGEYIYHVVHLEDTLSGASRTLYSSPATPSLIGHCCILWYPCMVLVYTQGAPPGFVLCWSPRNSAGLLGCSLSEQPWWASHNTGEGQPAVLLQTCLFATQKDVWNTKRSGVSDLMWHFYTMTRWRHSTK